MDWLGYTAWAQRFRWAHLAERCSLLATIPLLYAAVLLALIWGAQGRSDWRLASLRAAIVWGVTLVGITEILSPFGLITLPSLAVCWAIALALALAGYWRLGFWKDRPVLRWRRPPWLFVGLALPLAVIVLVTAVIAAVGWPNTADSMVYHLARVEHWKQNASVEFFPTHIPRQVSFPPFAEYAILHFTMLGGDERWANLVQWFSMVGSLVGVGLLARLLGASPRGQMLASLACATLPMGILQASSTQNDYVTAFWLVCFTTFLFERCHRTSPTFKSVFIGAALGLAILTKATVAYYAPPLALLYLLQRPARLRDLVRPVVLIGCVALAIPGPFLARNIAAPSWWVGPSRLTEFRPSAPGPGAPPAIIDTPENVFNDAMSPAMFASNVLRNVALQLGTPVPGLNVRIERLIVDWHQQVGLDINDPRTTWADFPFGVPGIRPDETFAGNFPQLALFGVALVTIVCLPRLRRDRRLLALPLALTAGFLLFCFIMKFQVFGSRLQLPLFVLWTPIIGRALDRWSSELLLATAFILAAWSVPYLLENRSHPLVGKQTIFNTTQVDQMFRWRPNMQQPYSRAIDLVQRLGCTRVGFFSDWNDHEYQFWQMLPMLKDGSGQFENVAITRPNAQIGVRSRPFTPCAVIDVRDGSNGRFEIGGQRFEPVWISNDVRVLLPSAP